MQCTPQGVKLQKLELFLTNLWSEWVLLNITKNAREQIH